MIASLFIGLIFGLLIDKQARKDRDERILELEQELKRFKDFIAVLRAKTEE